MPGTRTQLGPGPSKHLQTLSSSAFLGFGFPDGQVLRKVDEVVERYEGQGEDARKISKVYKSVWQRPNKSLPPPD